MSTDGGWTCCRLLFLPPHECRHYARVGFAADGSRCGDCRGARLRHGVPAKHAIARCPPACLRYRSCGLVLPLFGTRRLLQVMRGLEVLALVIAATARGYAQDAAEGAKGEQSYWCERAGDLARSFSTSGRGGLTVDVHSVMQMNPCDWIHNQYKMVDQTGFLRSCLPSNFRLYRLQLVTQHPVYAHRLAGIVRARLYNIEPTTCCTCRAQDATHLRCPRPCCH